MLQETVMCNYTICIHSSYFSDVVDVYCITVQLQPSHIHIRKEKLSIMPNAVQHVSIYIIQYVVFNISFYLTTCSNIMIFISILT